MAGAQEKSDILEQFRALDAIMEPKIKASIASYVVRLKGNPEDIVNLLAESYHGYADMAAITSDWLVDSGMTQEEVSELMHSHIQSMIMQNFNVDRANAILTTGKAPWLNEMIKFPTWRRMIYDLSQLHPSSPMLNLVIKRICDAGYLDEIAQVTSVANEVDVFSAVISHSISKLIKESEVELDKSLADFCRIACQSQHTYLFTQSMLHSVMPQHRHGPLIKRISQELQSFALSKQHDVWLYTLLFNGSSAFPLVVTTLQSILNARELLPAEVSKLHDLYCRPSPPPVDLLRVPALFELVIANLFSPSASLGPQDHVGRCVYLLAYAASARDEVAASGYVRSNTLELQDTVAAIESAVGALRETTLHASAMSVLHEALKFPVVSQGLLFWLRGVVCDPAFFSAFNTQIVPAHLALLDQIATSHELLHPSVLALLKSMFDVQYAVDPLLVLEVRRMLLDRFIYLMSLGHALPVMEFVHERIHSNDLSLTIHFVSQTLAICGAPFSAQFVESFTKILATDEVIASLKKKQSAMHEAITVLCRDMREVPSLRPAVRDTVTRIADEFRRK